MPEKFCDEFYQNYSGSNLDDFFSELIEEIKAIAENAKKAENDIIGGWKKERKNKKKEIEESKSEENKRISEHTLKAAIPAHAFALDIIKDVYKNIEKALKHLNSKNNNKQKLKALNKLCHQAYQDIRKTLDPAQHYLFTVFNHQLALAKVGSNRQWEPSEPVCAAATYGKLTKEWNDHCFQQAVLCLSGALSDRGMFLRNVPFHVAPEGAAFSFHAELLHSYAQILRHVHIEVKDNEIKPELVGQLLNFFKDTRAESQTASPRGWSYEYTPRPHPFDLEATCTATLALARINEMLDEQINSMILDHFTVRHISKELNLDKQFYPDYGLSLIPEEIKSSRAFRRQNALPEWPDLGFRRGESIALTLQWMRAHVIRMAPPSPDSGEESKSLHSLVLHGPPDSGKTSLVEALASSCGVKLVDITPSDLVKRGEADIERRARVVFEALSLLTRVVIHFNGFDSVLWRRDPNESSKSMLSFLTPGMLPKFRELNQQAKRRGVVYFLVTNLIGNLDEEVVREGQFDEKIGIYPPDILSRLGRFMDQYAMKKQEERSDESLKPLTYTYDELTRLCEVIQQTGDAPMQTLNKPGWFTAPKSKENNGLITAP